MIEKVFKIIFCVFAFVVTGCAMAAKDYTYMSGREYRDKPRLNQSLLGTSEVLNESAIQKILTSKVVLPKTINLAVIRLSDVSEGLDFQTIDTEIAEKFYNKSNWGAKVQTVIPMPQVMIAKPVTLTSLRYAAVLLQADALVIIKPVSYSDWQFQMFQENKAKGVTTLEVLLLDTRTSAVPYTTLITETVELLKNNADYSNEELIARAKKASEAKALLQVASAIQKFISANH